MRMKLGHIKLGASDLKRSVKWYTQVLGFEVEDVDALWERLKDKVTVIEPIWDTPRGTRKFTIADPDGNELGFSR